MESQPAPDRPRARDILDSLQAVMEWDQAAQFRAKVYAALLRKMIDAFGEDVLDIAEDMRRENGRYSGDLTIDIVENERKYQRDPALLIQDVHQMFEHHPRTWSRTCVCFYNPMPDRRTHELLSVRCTYAEAFRSIHEEKIGLTWCCWDMGFTSAIHPLFYQYMPRHQLKGDAFCQQWRTLASTPEEQAQMNSCDSTGWRSWK